MELTLDQALQKGIEAHKAGQVQEADRLYTAIIKAQPKHPDANHNMGVLTVGVGKVQEALPFFKAALAANPNTAQFWLSYIDAVIKLDKLPEAKAVLDQAKNNGAKGEAFDKLEQRLEGIEPSNITVSQNQDPPRDQLQPLIDFYTQGQFQQALDTVSQLLQQFPNSVFLYNIQGALLKSLGQLDASIDSYNKALAIKPDYADAYNNMGVTLQEQGKLEEAIETYNKALATKPDYADAYNNMGNALQEQGKLEEAIESCNKALAIKPDYAEVYNNMGNALEEQGKLEEAIEAYNKALALKPDYAEAYNNIYFALQAIKTQISSGQDLASYYPENNGSKYTQIATSILNHKLKQGGESKESSLNEALGLLSTAENISIKNPESYKTPAHLDPVLSENVTALVHFGRSGTTLLHSLIDGHSEVSTLPSIYFSEYFDHSTWEKIISGGWNNMADRFMAIYDVLFDASSKVVIANTSKKLIYNIGQKGGMANVGDQRDEVLSVDRALFSSELNRLMTYYDELDAFLFFRLVHAAYDRAINDMKQKSMIFYHIHNPNTYVQLNFLRSAPDTKWLMIVREPIQSCESWIQQPFRNNLHEKVVHRIFHMLYEVDNPIFQSRNSIGVRLEGLKAFPKKTIPTLCTWLGIKEEDSLYKMTAQGKKWWGDPSSPDFEKDGMEPFGKTSIKRKLGSVFSENDQFILRTLFYPFSVRFGYVEENPEQFKVDLQTVRPMLDGMFDFEKTIAARTQANPEKFMKSGSYLYLRSGLIERWNTLDRFGTYKNMITPLELD